MNKWYGFNFRIAWAENQEARTWIDIFILDKVVRTVISQEGSEIELWRIHRRWSRDERGHELTLDCFTNEGTATSIEELIKKNKSLKILQANNLLAGDFKKVTRGSNIHDISDDISTSNWPMELKKCWAYYIQGCSELLLYLIEFLTGSIQADFNDKDISKIESSYKELNNGIKEIWQRHGSHAFFHHLNAIFGYEPLLAKPSGFYGILASF